MECIIINKSYMGLGYTEKALIAMKELKSTCRKYNGIFSLLWHNIHFKNVEDKKMCKEIINC